MPGFPEQSIARPKNLQEFPPSLPKPINSSTNNQFTNRRILTRAWNSEAMKNVNGFGTRNKTYCLLTTLKTDKDTHKHVGTRAHTHTHAHTYTYADTPVARYIFLFWEPGTPVPPLSREVMVSTWVVTAQWVLSAQTLTLRVNHLLVSIGCGSSHTQYYNQGLLVLTV